MYVQTMRYHLNSKNDYGQDTGLFRKNESGFLLLYNICVE